MREIPHFDVSEHAQKRLIRDDKMLLGVIGEGGKKRRFKRNTHINDDFSVNRRFFPPPFLTKAPCHSEWSQT